MVHPAIIAHTSNDNKNSNKHKKKKKHPVKPLLNPIPVKQIISDWKKFKDYQGRKVANFYAFAYLTGARGSEINQVRASDIKLIRKQTDKGEEKWLIVEMPTLKNRLYKTRTLPILVKDPYTEMVNDLWEWVQLFRPYEKLFPYTRDYLRRWLTPRKMGGKVRGWRELKAPLIETTAFFWDTNKKKPYKRNYYTHYLRHCRLTHLASHHKFDALKLMYWAGWTDPKLANIYIRLDWLSLAKAIQVYDEW